METKYINISVKGLNAGGLQRSIHDELVALGDTITKAITDANDKKKTSILFELPHIFLAPDMNTKEIRISIYYKIMKNLQREGFKVTYRASKPPAPPKSVLEIQWPGQVLQSAKQLQQSTKSQLDMSSLPGLL